MARDYNALQIGKHVFARQTPDDLVYKIERSKFVIANLTASGAPAVSTLGFADPVGLVRSQEVATIADLIPGRTAIRGKAWRNNDSVIQGSCQERRSKRSTEVIICIAIDTVDENEGTSDVLVLRLQRIVTIDQHPRLLSGELYPFRAVWAHRRARCTYHGDSSKQKSENHERQCTALEPRGDAGVEVWQPRRSPLFRVIPESRATRSNPLNI